MLASAQTISKTRLTLVASTGVSDDLASSTETETWSKSCREATMRMLIKRRLTRSARPWNGCGATSTTEYVSPCHSIMYLAPFTRPAAWRVSSYKSFAGFCSLWSCSTVAMLSHSDSQHCEQNPHSPSAARSECWSAQLAWNL